MEETRLQFYNLWGPKTNTPIMVDKKSSRQMVYWGENNRLPQFIFDQYLQCSDLQALVNRTADYLCGSEIHINKPDQVLTSCDSFETLVSKCVFDYVLFGGFCLECIRNSKGEIVRVNYIDVMKVRVDEDLTTAYLNDNWSIYSSKRVQQLPLFNRDEQQPHFIYYYRGTITRNINPISIWQSALKSVEVLNETRNFNLNEIKNNFSANTIVTLNGTSIKSSELQEIKDKLTHQYEGSGNAGKTLLITNSNSDGKVEVQRLDSEKTVDIYKSVQESSQSDLRAAFSMSEILLGYTVSTGFQAVEYENVYKLYLNTVIVPLRNNFERALNNIGIDVEFVDKQIDWKE